MALFQESAELRELARAVIAARDEVAHVELPDVLFLWEEDTKPNAAGRCYKLIGHPIQVFTHARWAIVFYRAHCELLSDDQLAWLMFHELWHIPATGDRLVDHDLQDFATIVGEAGVGWIDPGAVVPGLVLHNAAESHNEDGREADAL